MMDQARAALRGECYYLPQTSSGTEDYFLVTQVVASNKYRGLLLSTGERCSLLFFPNKNGAFHLVRGATTQHFDRIRGPVSRKVVEQEVDHKQTLYRIAAKSAEQRRRLFYRNSNRFIRTWDTLPSVCQ